MRFFRHDLQAPPPQQHLGRWANTSKIPNFQNGKFWFSLLRNKAWKFDAHALCWCKKQMAKGIHLFLLPLSHCKNKEKKRRGGNVCNFQGDVIHTPGNGNKAKWLFLSLCLQVKILLPCFQCQRNKTGPILWHRHNAPWRLSLVCYTCTATGSQLKTLPKLEKTSRILSPLPLLQIMRTFPSISYFFLSGRWKIGDNSFSI